MMMMMMMILVKVLVKKRAIKVGIFPSKKIGFIYFNEKLIPKFMMSQNGKQMLPIYVLPNISRSKGNQTMTCG